MFPIFMPIRVDSTPERERPSDVSSLREAVVGLQRQVENQRVLLRALFALLQERQGLTERDLLTYFRRAMDERGATTVKTCTFCSRPVSLKFERCMYCDLPQPAASAFELI